MTMTRIEEQTLQGVEFVLPGSFVQPKVTPICKENEAFKRSCEKLVEETRNNLNEITLHMALLRLQENFFSCLRMAPKACMKHMFSEKVVCLMTSYQASFMQLYELKLQINPVRLQEEIPLPAPVTNIIRYEGFALGETLDLEEAEAQSMA